MSSKKFPSREENSVTIAPIVIPLLTNLNDNPPKRKSPNSRSPNTVSPTSSTSVTPLNMATPHTSRSSFGSGNGKISGFRTNSVEEYGSVDDTSPLKTRSLKGLKRHLTARSTRKPKGGTPPVFVPTPAREERSNFSKQAALLKQDKEEDRLFELLINRLQNQLDNANNDAYPSFQYNVVSGDENDIVLRRSMSVEGDGLTVLDLNRIEGELVAKYKRNSIELENELESLLRKEFSKLHTQKDFMKGEYSDTF